MSSLRYHLRQTTQFPITALSRARAAVLQHAKEPAGTCLIPQQPRDGRGISAPGWHGLPAASAAQQCEASCTRTASPEHQGWDGATTLLLA